MSYSDKEKDNVVKNQLDGNLDIIDTSPIDDMVDGAEKTSRIKETEGSRISTMPAIHEISD